VTTDTSIAVGHRDCGDARPAFGRQCGDPATARIALTRGRDDGGTRAFDHQHAQILIAPFADAQQHGPPSGRILAQRQPEPCAEMAARFLVKVKAMLARGIALDSGGAEDRVGEGVPGIAPAKAASRVS
jgi:hypothetical protein